MKFSSERLRRYIRIEGHVSPQGDLENYFFLKRVNGLTQVFNCSSPASWPNQITFFEEGVDSFSLSPCGLYVAVLVNSGGSEHGPIVLIDLENQVSKVVLQEPDTQSGGIVWSADGSRFLFRSNIENKRDYKIYEYKLGVDSYALRIDCQGWGYPIQYSPCERYILYGVASSGANQDLYMYNVKDDDSKHLTPHEGDVRYEALLLSCGEKIILLSDIHSEFKRLYIMNTDGKNKRSVGNEYSWELSSLEVSRDSRYAAFVINEAGYSRLAVVEIQTGLELALPEFKGVIGSYKFSSENGLLLSYQSSKQSSDCYYFKLGGDSLSQLTFSSYQGLNKDLFIEPELIEYESFDGLRIPAFLYLPKGCKAGSPVPMVIHFHGGPEGQFKPIFYKHLQYLLELGIGVCAPNIRGSSGYGAEYMALDDYRKRPDAIQDGIELAKFLVEKGYTSFDKLGVVGGSYGGFMVLALITNAPKYFAAAVNVVGISNLVTFLKNTKPYRRKLREAEYGPLNDEIFLESISPIHKLSEVRTPLLVVHGVTDPRVPISEAEQLVGGLKLAKKEVDYLFFEDEGHGIRKLSNQIEYFEAMIKFFIKNLF